MRQITPILLAVIAVAFAVVLPAGADARQAITIQSFLYAQPDPAAPNDPNRFVVTGCFVITGAIDDRGGVLVRDAAGNAVGCSSADGIRGTAEFDGLGHLKTGAPSVLQATHTMYGRHGSIEIAFEGKYQPVQSIGGRLISVSGPGGAWQISGGTGAYTSLQGTGTATAVGDFTDAFAGVGPVTVVHTETGDVHWRG
jgi:hypothetical protein